MDIETAYAHFKGETPEILAAFDIYVKMGDKRSLTAVALQLNVSKAVVAKWSKVYEWKARLLEWQEEAVERAKEEAKKAFFLDTKNMLSFKYEILNDLKDRFDVKRKCSTCKVKHLNVGDMIEILHVIKTELGEPTSIAKGVYTEDKPNPFKDVFSSFNSLFVKKDEPSNEAD